MTQDGVSSKVHADSTSLFSLGAELVLPRLKVWAGGKGVSGRSHGFHVLLQTGDELLSLQSISALARWVSLSLRGQV